MSLKVNKIRCWTLNEGLAVVRLLQPLTRRVDYHLAIVAGVVNKGYSDKDLDLYFLPLDNSEHQPEPDRMKSILDALYGEGEPIADPAYDEVPGSVYRHKLIYRVDGKRVDAFIL